MTVKYYTIKDDNQPYSGDIWIQSNSPLRNLCIDGETNPLVNLSTGQIWSSQTAFGCQGPDYFVEVEKVEMKFSRNVTIKKEYRV